MNRNRIFPTLKEAWRWGEIWQRYANLTTPYMHSLTVLRLGDDDAVTPPARRFRAHVWAAGDTDR